MDEEFSIETSITDPDGDSFTYSWSIIGDQYSPSLTGSGLSRTFSPPGPGRYKISVTATDEHGNEDTRSDFVNVTNRAPTFLSLPPVQTAVGGIAASEGDMSTTFQVSTVANDPDGLPLTYTWSVEGPSGVDGDPNLTPTGIDNGVEFIAPNAGEYTVSVVVSDGFDSISDSSSITVNNRIPSVSLSFSPSEPVRDETITLTATVIDEDKQNIDFTWTGFEFFTDFEVTSTTGPQEITTGVDSGKYRSREIIQFSLGEIQTKTIGVSITDGYASVSDSVDITIFNSLPGLTPTLSYPSEGNDFARPGVITSSTSVDSEGETVITYTNRPGKHALISVIKSDADEDDILTLEWALDSYDPTVDLLTSTDELDEFAFHSTNLGTRIITFTASDSIDTIHESIEFVVDTVGPTGIVINKPFGGAAISNTRGSATNLQIDGGASASHPDSPHLTLSTHSWSITSRPAGAGSHRARIEQPSDPSDFTSQARFLSYGTGVTAGLAAIGDYEITVTITDSLGNTSTDSVTITVS
jgi:hypothetical protein